MQKIVNHNTRSPEYITQINNNDPGLYIDKDGDIWIVSENRRLEYVFSEGSSRAVRETCESKLPQYRIQRLESTSSVTFRNN